MKITDTEKKFLDNITIRFHNISNPKAPHHMCMITLNDWKKIIKMLSSDTINEINRVGTKDVQC